MKISKTLFFLVLVLVQLAFALHLQATHDIEHEFCWKDSYGRGVGTIPTDCGNKEKLGNLCYPRCPSGYTRVGLNCHQNCPSNFISDGLYCKLPEYGRGGGYPWKYADGFNDKGMFNRCERYHGPGNCEKYGAIVYPKCKPGFSPYRCCTCRPPAPNCDALGFAGGAEISCNKKVIIGQASPADCPAGKQYDAGLCYPQCTSGYYGVGPVCWANTPPEWVGCGMGAADDSNSCTETIFNQAASLGQLAFRIATLGSASGASSAANAGKPATLTNKLTELKAAIRSNKVIAKVADKAKQLKKLQEKGEKITQSFQKAVDSADALEQVAALNENKATDADIVRVSAHVAALADPTGVASVIEANSYLTCSRIFKK